MKKLLALLLALVMVLGLAACGGGSTSTTSSNNTTSANTGGTSAEEGDSGPASGEAVTLRVGTANSLGTCLLNDNNGDCYTAIYLVYDSLFSYDPETREVYSDVLEDYGYSEDGMTLTLTIKPGVMFSNGVEATAEDVLFSIQNYVDRETIITAFFQAMDFANASISEDGMTVTIPMTTEFSPTVDEIGNLPLYCKSWADEVGWDSEDWISNPVGSGPYKVSEYVTDSHIFLEKRDDYWGDYTSNIDSFEIYYYGEPATMAMDLETGSIDLALELLETDYNRFQDSATIATDTISAGENRLLNFSSSNEYLQDENVRLAIAYGVNWAEVADAADGGISPTATSLIISSSDFYQDVGAYEYDPDLAKSYLDSSAYAGQEINLLLVSTSEDDQVKMSTVVQYYLSELGINLETQFLDFPSALATWLDDGTDLMWTDSSIGSVLSEPYASLRATSDITGGIPGAIVADDEYQELLNAATFTLDPEVRMEKFGELQEYNKEHAFVVPVLEEFVAIAWNTEVIQSVNILNGTDANLRNLVLA